MPSYLWLIDWAEGLDEQLSSLSKSDRLALFAKIAALASAENPYNLPGVEMLFEKRFARLRRIRQGNSRLLFEIEAGEIVDQKHRYKGRLILLSVTNRRDTYN